jgi:uncharacterized protein (DUF1015 family)
MAEIAPFSGLRYNPEKLATLADVVTPPYDVISPKDQELFHQISPYNMIHLELGKTTPQDTPTNNAHARAARAFLEWQRAEVLIRDERPSLYYYELTFSVSPEVRQTRYGFICALRLEDFSSGFVRPHERTFQAVKDERLSLMQACEANLSPVFALYSDPAMIVDHTLRIGRERAPVIAFEDREGLEHRMWRVVNPEVLERVSTFMLDKPIFIADGHHRYETALNYRTIQHQRLGNSSPQAPYEFIMMYLSNLDQGGLMILPTHRLLRHMGPWEPQGFLRDASAYFDITDYPLTAQGRRQWCEDLEKGRSTTDNLIGLHWRQADALYLLKARPEVVSSYLASRGINQLLHHLDVVILDQLLLRHLLEVSDAFLANERNIHFKHDLIEAVSAVQSGAYEAGFFVNPTRIEQVQEVASAGLIMPHKATYFYPKVGSGLVINPLATT